MSRRSDLRRRQRAQERSARNNAEAFETLKAAGELSVAGAARGSASTTTARQEQAWDYFHTVPELYYVANFYGDLLARGALIIEVKDAEGNWVPGVEAGAALTTDAAAAQDALNVLGSHDRLIRAWSISDIVVGESYLVGTFGQPGWTLRSTRELKYSGSEWMWTKPQENGSTEMGEGVSVCRLWTPDPSMPDMAISPVLPLIDVLAQIVAMGDAITAAALSRALMGILRMPPDPNPKPIDQAVETTDAGSLQQDLIDVVSIAIQKPRDAARFVPPMVEIPEDVPEHAFKLVPLTEGWDAFPASELLEAAVHRFARGMPLPVETTLGHQQTTFANGAEIARSLKADHLEPALERFCADVTSGYLVPALTPDPEAPFDPMAPPRALVDFSAVRIGFTVGDIRGPDIAALAAAAKTLIDAGFDPAQVLDQVGLEPMDHTGVVTPSPDVVVAP